MSDPNLKRLIEISKRPGNDECCDCTATDPEWASYNLGIFVCTNCAGIHRKMGSHISKVKSMRLDRWTDEQIQLMNGMGNIKARTYYEQHVPIAYKNPKPRDCHVLKEQWIQAKYEREEFIYPEKQVYNTGQLEMYLSKRGKEDEKFYPRKFVLDDIKDTVVYYVKENKEPKAVIRLSELNVTFAPEKIGHPNGLQLSYFKDGSTRNLYVYTLNGKDIVDFYTAIRVAKLNRLKVAFPDANDAELLHRLTRDFLKEGYLYKTGPRISDSYKKRWFTLDDRKLMYTDSPLNAYARGEVFLGHSSDNFQVQQGVPHGCRDQGFSFTVRTPNRVFVLSADTFAERQEWMQAIDSVFNKPLTPQDNSR
ncbi:hypothetical protein CHUAL_003098 [Chamberlinius hualienensis]